MECALWQTYVGDWRGMVDIFVQIIKKTERKRDEKMTHSHNGKEAKGK